VGRRGLVQNRQSFLSPIFDQFTGSAPKRGAVCLCLIEESACRCSDEGCDKPSPSFYAQSQRLSVPHHVREILSSVIPSTPLPFMKPLRTLSFVMLATAMAFSSTATAAPGDVDTGFNPNANSTVYSTAVQPDGKTLIGGTFTTVNGGTRNHIARLNTDGTLDGGFNPNVGGTVYSTAVLADGKILIAGGFTTVGGAARNYIARLNADGTLDTGFNLNVDGITPIIYSALVQSDGKFVIAGDFSTVGGVTRNRIARFNADGSLETNFNPNANNTVYNMTVQSDGKIVIGGTFYLVGAVTRNNLARLNSDGTLDTGFNPNANSNVYSTVVQADGKILIGGNFSTVAGVTRNRIARLNADGSLDTGFNPNANSDVYSTVVQADGKILIGGFFNTLAGVTRNYIARLNTDGAADSTFNPNANYVVYGTSLQADGKIVIGGGFSTVGGVTRNSIARLANDVITQSLSASSSARVEWLRGGSSPETMQTTFELSTDGATTWTVLGAGTRISGGWELTGLSLPVGGQIRARARTIGGQYGGSSGLVETIAPFGLQPDIAVEQPALVSIADGGPQDFGSVLVGNNNSLTFTIRNSGAANLTGLGITLDGANASDFTLTANPTSPVAAAGTTTFTVQFAPTSSGARTAALHIASNVTGSKNPYDINLTGTGTVPDISVEQPALTTVADGGSKAFGSVLVGTSTSLVFTVKNPGAGDLTGLGITFDGTNATDFSVTSSPTTPVTGPNGSTTFTVLFTPLAGGARTAALHITSNVTGTKNPYDINLTGTGTVPDISVEQPALTTVADGGTKAFGTVVVGSSTSLVFTVKNPGAGDLTGLGITFDGTNATDFSVTASPTTPVTGPSGSTTFTVQFAPTGSGARTAALHIASNVTGSKNPYDITLTGTATAPDISVEQPALTTVADGGAKDFGIAAVGSSASLTFTIRNPGTASLTGFGITFDGANAADFSVTTNPTSPVAAAGTTTFIVRFAPSGAGVRAAALHITSNVTGSKSPYDISLTGTGTAPDISVEQPALTNIADGGSKDFGSVANGSNTSLTFTVRNTGTADLTGLTITKDGTNSAEFTVTTNPTTPVVASATTTFTVRFAPTGTGLRTGALHIASNVVGSKNPFDINLTGTGSGAGNADPAFASGAGSYVLSTAVQTDGKIIIGGGFTTVGGAARNYIARLNADSTLDTGFNPSANDWVYSTAVQTDGKIVMGGSFTSLGGGARSYIARLNADGTLDAGFNPSVNDWVFSAAIQADGKIVIGGSFTSVGGVAHNRMARFNANGTLDSGFNPVLDGEVYSMAVQPDGKIIIGGVFTTAGGAAHSRVARLNADGTIDAGFNPNVNSSVYNTALQPDGKIIIGGSFTAVGGTARNHLAKLNADGTLDTFNPSVNGDVDSTTAQADGKIILGGSFTTVGGTARNYLARVNADGTLDTSFNPNASGSVFSTTLQGDGKIIIGGDFANVGGVSSNRITRLENDAATQSLTMPNASRLQWLRGGASPETVQVTFQLSTDGGGTWTTLGTGTRSRLVTGWELNGLSLPGSGLVRARAQITGGYSNCSSGFVESVAAITGLPATPDIAVEQPALTAITDGGSKAFGYVLTGSNASLTFTIRNTGTANLTGLGISVDGANASDFTVTTTPASTVAGPNGSTSFTVLFAPASAGLKAAALHIASNVTGSKNPYDISLSGRALDPNADDDGDGITNSTELALAALGFDPLVNNNALRTTLQNNASALGLYKSTDVQTLALGSPLLSRDVATGHFHLSIDILKSPDMTGWAPLLGFSPTYDALSGKIDIEITPDASNAQFYRVLGAKP